MRELLSGGKPKTSPTWNYFGEIFIVFTILLPLLGLLPFPFIFTFDISFRYDTSIALLQSISLILFKNDGTYKINTCIKYFLMIARAYITINDFLYDLP